MNNSHASYFKLSDSVEDGYRRKMFARRPLLCGLPHNVPLVWATVHSWADGVTFHMEGTGVEDMPFEIFGWKLFSERLKLMVDTAELRGVTFYPISVISEKAMELPKYWYGHFVHLSDTIDFDRSTFSWFEIPPHLVAAAKTDRVLNMVKYAFKRDDVKDWDFFRPTECTAAAFCSDRFRRIFEENRCTGIGFTPVPVT